MMIILFIPKANVRHKNVKKEKKHKLFHDKRKYLFIYPCYYLSHDEQKGGSSYFLRIT